MIDWMMNLRDDLSRKFEQELTVLEESLNMPYVTSVERIAEERGETRGRAEGSASVLLKQLGLICGPVPDAVAQRIRGLSFEALETLSEALLDFRSLHDVQAWLDAHDASGR